MFEFEEDEAPRIADEPVTERITFTPPTLPLGFLYAEAA